MQDTDIGGTLRSFPTTAPRPVDQLVTLYWKPVYCFIRHSWAKSNEDAKDLTQEFFTRMVLEGGLVHKYDPERGRFRVFLKTALVNFLRDVTKTAGREKRGGDAKVLELPVDDVLPDFGARAPEEAFDEAWRRVVIDRAVERLKQDLRPLHWEVFKRYDIDAAGSYEDVGRELGLKTRTVKKYLTIARRRFQYAVRDAMADTVDTQENLAREMEELFHA